MVFDEMLRMLKEGIFMEFEDVEITEEFIRRYEDYQKRAKNRELEENES